MNKITRHNINYFLENFSEDIVDNLIKLLQNNTLTLSSDDFKLKDELHISSSEVPTIKKIFKDFKTTETLTTVITLLNEIRNLEEQKLKSTKLVSTTPKISHEESDKTNLMIKQLFLNAKKSITLVGYTMDNKEDTKEFFDIIKR